MSTRLSSISVQVLDSSRVNVDVLVHGAPVQREDGHQYFSIILGTCW